MDECIKELMNEWINRQTNKETPPYPAHYHISVHIHPLLRTGFDCLGSLQKGTACTHHPDYRKTILPQNQNRDHGHHGENTILKVHI